MAKMVDQLTDIFEKASSPATRAGATVERVGKMRNNRVDIDVIALHMTKNSPNGHAYTREDVKTLAKVAQDSKTRVLITARQGRTLMEDQQQVPPDIDGHLA